MILILVFFGLIVGLCFVMDADVMTTLYHLYRTKYRKQCFEGKTIWIVGASSGLGEHLVYQSAAQNAKCIIISSRRRDQLERVAETASTHNASTKLVVAPFDICSFVEDNDGRTKCEQFIVDLITEHDIKDIDELVMNTGITGRGLALNTTLDVMQRLVTVNGFGIIVFVQSFISVLRELKWIKKSNTNKSRGIYITSSVAGLVGAPGQSAYAAAKHAINGFMKSLRFEVVRDKLHIAIVCPGPFRPSEHSNDGLGESVKSSSGRLLKADALKKKMTAQRAAELYVTVMVHKITESWLCGGSILLFVYIMQYLPVLTSVLVKFVGPMRMKDIIHKAQQKRD